MGLGMELGMQIKGRHVRPACPFLDEGNIKYSIYYSILVAESICLAGRRRGGDSGRDWKGVG